MDDDYQLELEIQLQMNFCPLCHQSKLSPHQAFEYHNKWNKCTHCGYMELIEHTRYRILQTLDNTQVPESFTDPVLLHRQDKLTSMEKNSKSVEKCNNCSNKANKPTN